MPLGGDVGTLGGEVVYTLNDPTVTHIVDSLA